MQYTVGDFAARFQGKLRLIAGGQGLNQPITEVGLLDYELVRGLKGKYQRNNFYEGQLVLTSFLYAKDDSYQITDAIRYLYNKGARALVIKNVFHLQLPDAAVRYANVRNFPVYLMSDDVFFDEVILEVGGAIRNCEDRVWAQRKIDQLVLDAANPDVVTACARELNPSMAGEHYVVLARARVRAHGVTSLKQDNAVSLVRTMMWGYDPSAGNAVYLYNDGVLLICSGEDTARDRIEQTCAHLARVLNPVRDADDIVSGAADELGSDWSVGASRLHFEASELGQSILEAQRAQRYASMREEQVARYDSLGAMQPLLPFAETTPMRRFTDDVLGPIFEYDAERASKLFVTLKTFCQSGRNLQETARLLDQHVNTVRHRLDRIHVETGLDWREPAQADQLALACLLHECQRVLRAD